MSDTPIKDEKTAKKLCFLIGPIGEDGSATRTHADWLLQGIIEPVFRDNFSDFRVERADSITEPGMIDSQVIIRLLDADLVIADMSHHNANAFYEMGIRHVVRKPIIHMFQTGTNIPFDVKPYRAIPFAYDHPNNLTRAQKLLIPQIREVIAPEYQVENPVTKARGQIQIDQHATPQDLLVEQKMQDMAASIRDLRQSVERQTIGLNTLNNFRNINKRVRNFKFKIDIDGDVNPNIIRSIDRVMMGSAAEIYDINVDDGKLIVSAENFPKGERDVEDLMQNLYTSDDEIRRVECEELAMSISRA